MAAMTPAPLSATTKNDTRQKAEVLTSIKASALIMPGKAKCSATP